MRQGISKLFGPIASAMFFKITLSGSKEKKWIWFFFIFFLKTLYRPHCRKFPYFFGDFDDFVYCWTFEILHLHICLLLNLCTFFTSEPLRLCHRLCICLLLNLWILFTAEPLRLSVCCWTFEFSLLLNLWDYLFAAAEGSAANRQVSKESQRFSSKENPKVQQQIDNLKGSAVEKIQRFSSKQTSKQRISKVQQ